MVDDELNGEIVDFSHFKLEPHVEKALEVADAISVAGSPINALDCLFAAVIVSETWQSEAFITISDMLSLKTIPKAPHIKTGVPVKMEVSPSLAQSVSKAELFLGGRIWGRDFITIVLLSNDPALELFAKQQDIHLETLRQRWFEFVTSTEERRSREEWEKWRNIVKTNPQKQKVPLNGNAFLLTWNPEDEETSEAYLEKQAETLKKEGSLVMSWGTGNRRNMPVGSRVYLLRQGNNLGIIGRGVTLGQPFLPGQTTKSSDKSNRQRYLVEVRWDRLTIQPIITINELVRLTGTEDPWHPRASGTQIDENIAQKLENLFPPDHFNEPDTIARFAKTLSDMDHANDWIGVGPDVIALSTLMAVYNLEPPLSVALFGDWGAGKTFLMRRIQERIETLEQIGCDQMKNQSNKKDNEKNKEEQTRYCSSILQVEFNAWHYTESNLWASLVNHIFEKLHEKLSDESKKSPKKREEHIEEAFKEFETARAARAESEACIKFIESEINAVNIMVEDANSELEKAQIALKNALQENVWSVIDEKLKNEINQALPEENSKENGKKLSEDDRKKIEGLREALAHFGFRNSLEPSQNVYTKIQQFHSVSGRAKEVIGSLIATRKGVWGGAIATVAITSSVLLADMLGISAISITPAVIAVPSWLAERGFSARKCFEKIQIADDWLTKLKEDEDARIAQNIEMARLEVHQRQEAYSNAIRQLNDTKKREATARDELKRLTAREQIRRFVDARVTDQSYSNHLGLISMIRRDFEGLSELMDWDRQKEEGQLVERVRKKLELKELPTIERIILFIDDLDRCQPERVVEVLEAVHLLMTFRLFVVVVAVDPRWVFEALNKRYPHLIDPQRGNYKQAINKTGMVEEATTHDYIEKIFNIPFWVKPMTPTACQDLLAGYLEFDRKTIQVNDNKVKDFLINEQKKENDRIHQSSKRRHASETEDKNNVYGNSNIKNPDISNRKHEDDSKQEKIEIANRAITNVKIDKYEWDFIENIAEYLGNSPRRIKRFANIYRLLKSGLNHEEASKFKNSNGSHGDFKVVLTFLAVVTGAPTLAPQILTKAYQNRKDINTIDLTEKIDIIQGTDPEELENAKGALKHLKNIIIEEEAIELWAPRIMRYGFNLTPIKIDDNNNDVKKRK